MRAALLEERSTSLNVVGDVEIRAPYAGEVLVKIAFCGLCHSDLGVIQMGLEAEVPLILGHEAAGEVVEVGAGVTEVRPGDKVVMTTLASCGRCRPCVSGHPALCVQNDSMRLSVPLPDGSSGLSQGTREVHRGLGVAGFAEYILTTPRSLTVLDASTPLDIACLLGCAVRTGVGAVVNTARVPEGDSVLVMGLGGVGLSIVMGASVAAAAPIIVSDPVEERRAAALSFGASVAVDPTTEDLADAVNQATGGIGVDFAFDAAGSSDLLRIGFDLTGRGGTVVSVGAAWGDLTIPALDLMTAEKRLIGSLLGTSLVHRDVPKLLKMWRAGELPLDRLISRRRPIEEINEGFDDMAAGRELRTIIEF
jgi:S-(hydroxymethyl)glutathione dehydrogenase / alcohol dehydrogenase